MVVGGSPPPRSTAGEEWRGRGARAPPWANQRINLVDIYYNYYVVMSVCTTLLTANS